MAAAPQHLLSIPLNGFSALPVQLPTGTASTFQFHWMDSFLYSLCLNTDTPFSLSIPLNGFREQRLTARLVASSPPFNSIEWIHFTSIPVSVFITRIIFQFHWMDSRLYWFITFALTTTHFQFHWMDSVLSPPLHRPRVVAFNSIEWIHVFC